MAIGSNSYGTVTEVEALTRTYTDGGVYTMATTPTLTGVETFVDRVSGVLNLLLAEAGFAVPVTQADAALAVDEFAVEHAAALCHAANGAGPYLPGAEGLRGRSPLGALREEAAAFVAAHADGLAALGATRSRAGTYGLQCRTEDSGGDELVPFFQREMMGNTVVDWED